METSERYDVADALLSLSHEAMEIDTPEGGISTLAQTDLKSSDMIKLEDDLQKLKLELEMAKQTNDKMSLTEESFKGNDEKVKTYTSLPTFALLMLILQTIQPYMKQSTALSPFQKLLLTLMRFRLKVSVDYLSCIFGVCTTTVTRAFNDTLDVLYYRLVPSLIKWPSREELRQSLPASFRESFKSCACIIDCFEVFIERPSNLLARAQTWSSYKHHNTAKYLIGIAPQGSIIFLSKGWGGRTSDQFLTELCGFLEKLLPNDLILADRGFTIGEMLEAICCVLGIPAFTKGKSQLDPLDLETTRRLANVRIHVERVIGLVRQKFLIFDGSVPLTMLEADEHGVTQLDKIVAVCCALCNCCPSIVPFD